MTAKRCVLAPLVHQTARIWIQSGSGWNASYLSMIASKSPCETPRVSVSNTASVCLIPLQCVYSCYTCIMTAKWCVSACRVHQKARIRIQSGSGWKASYLSMIALRSSCETQRVQSVYSRYKRFIAKQCVVACLVHQTARVRNVSRWIQSGSGWKASYLSIIAFSSSCETPRVNVPNTTSVCLFALQAFHNHETVRVSVTCSPNGACSRRFQVDPFRVRLEWMLLDDRVRSACPAPQTARAGMAYPQTGACSQRLVAVSMSRPLNDARKQLFVSATADVVTRRVLATVRTLTSWACIPIADCDRTILLLFVGNRRGKYS